MTSSKPVLGYWNIRGLAEHIRTLLVYKGVDFEDKRYGVAPPFDRSDWLSVKFTLGLDFPNLPYFFDGDVKLTQSCAILRYLGSKYQLDGTTEEEKNRIALVEHQVSDLIMKLIMVSYSPDCDKLKEDYLKTVPEQLEQLSKFLKDRSFVAGKNLSYADFLMHEHLVKVEAFVPGSLAPYDNLVKFVERIHSLPRVADYVKKREPSYFNGLIAKWNAKY